MRILILGATGFVGGELVRLLRDQQEVEVIAGVRKMDRRAAALGVQTCIFSASDAASIDHAMNGVTHVVNCIMGSPRHMIAASSQIFSNAVRRRLTRVIHLSSVAVYGEATGLIGPDSPFGGDIDWYGAAKIKCEQLVPPGAPVVILRPALVYGIGSHLWTLRIARLLQSNRLGDLGEEGDGTCNLIHVRDVARAIAAALVLPGIDGERFCLVGPQPPTWNEYLMNFGKSLGAVPVARIPRWQLKVEARYLAPVLKIAELGSLKTGLNLDTPPPITPGLARLFGKRVCYDDSNAEQLYSGVRTLWQTGVDECARILTNRVDRTSQQRPVEKAVEQGHA